MVVAVLLTFYVLIILDVLMKVAIVVKKRTDYNVTHGSSLTQS